MDQLLHATIIVARLQFFQLRFRVIIVHLPRSLAPEVIVVHVVVVRMIMCISVVVMLFFSLVRELFILVLYYSLLLCLLGFPVFDHVVEGLVQFVQAVLFIVLEFATHLASLEGCTRVLLNGLLVE